MLYDTHCDFTMVNWIATLNIVFSVTNTIRLAQ